MEFVEVTFAASGVHEIFVEERGAFGAGGVFPLGLIRKEEVGVLLPVALETGGLGSRGGSGAVLVIAEQVITIDNGELAL